MFIFKKKYFFIIESIKDIDLSKLKISNKFNIIYRFGNLTEKVGDLLIYRNLCKIKRIGFYISNNTSLMSSLKADGLYVSAFNKSLKILQLKNTIYKVIGSAHNLKELDVKIKQGCSTIFFSRIFKTHYKNKKGCHGLIKFNLINHNCRDVLIPLGGINKKNSNKIKHVKTEGIALSSQIKIDNLFNLKLY